MYSVWISIVVLNVDVKAAKVEVTTGQSLKGTNCRLVNLLRGWTFSRESKVVMCYSAIGSYRFFHDPSKITGFEVKTQYFYTHNYAFYDIIVNIEHHWDFLTIQKGSNAYAKIARPKNAGEGVGGVGDNVMYVGQLNECLVKGIWDQQTPILNLVHISSTCKHASTSSLMVASKSLLWLPS